MKATEQYFPLLLFIMLYKVVPTFESVDEMFVNDLSNKVYSFTVFDMLVPTFESTNEILKSELSNESYIAILSCGAVYCAI